MLSFGVVAGGIMPASIHISMVCINIYPVINPYNGIIWYTWKGSEYSLKFTEMKTRHNI